MNTQNNTESIRIDKSVLESIKKIISTTGQTVKGYVEVNLKKQVEKDLSKISKKELIKIAGIAYEKEK
jgi:prophage antirepressor-like protein